MTSVHSRSRWSRGGADLVSRPSSPRRAPGKPDGMRRPYQEELAVNSIDLLRRRARTMLLAFAAAAATLPVVAPARAETNIALTAAGFSPAAVTVEAGTAIHFTNSSIVPGAVTSADGLFDSGPLAPGAGFSI